MIPETLIYCPDASLSGCLAKAVQRLKFGPICAARVGAALHMLRSRKFPAVIVDCVEKSAATDLFQLCRNTGSNKTSVVIALTEGNESAMHWGVNFAVQRPANQDLRAFMTVLRAAESMIQLDYRRYRRIPIRSLAVLDNDERILQVPTLNISEGGMCLQGELAGWNKEHSIQIAHPERGLRFQAKSYLVWSRNGCSGIQFRFMSTSSREALSCWLESQ